MPSTPRRSRAIAGAAGPGGLGVLLLAAACGAEPGAVGRARLAVGAVPDGVASLSVAVFDEDGLVVSTTVSPPRAELDLGVPAEVPLLFQVVARTATPAAGGFAGGLPAFVGRTERTVPLTRSPVRVGLEARPAGGLRLRITAAPGIPAGLLRIRSDGGVPGVGYRVNPLALPGLARPVLGRGRQQITYESSEPERIVMVRGGADLWVAAETIAVAEVRLEPPAARPRLQLVARDGAGAPVNPVEARSGPLSLTLAFDDGAAEPGRVVQLSAETTGSARLVGLPEVVRGVPATVSGLTVEGEGRLVVRAVGPASGALAVLYAGPTAGGAPVGLVLAVVDPPRLRDGTELELWTVDAGGRLTPPPAGTLSLADSDPWVVRPDGDSVPVEPRAADARVVRRIALPSRPLTAPAFVRAALFTGTGTLTATLGLP